MSASHDMLYFVLDRERDHAVNIIVCFEMCSFKYLIHVVFLLKVGVTVQKLSMVASSSRPTELHWRLVITAAASDIIYIHMCNFCVHVLHLMVCHCPVPINKGALYVIMLYSITPCISSSPPPSSSSSS